MTWFGDAATFYGVTFEIQWGAFEVASGRYMPITAAEFLGGFFPQMSTWLLGRLVDFQQ